jgi:hypothetical protein
VSGVSGNGRDPRNPVVRWMEQVRSGEVMGGPL